MNEQKKEEVLVTEFQNLFLQCFLKHQKEFNFLDICAEELKVPKTTVSYYLMRLKDKKVLIKEDYNKFRLNESITIVIGRKPKSKKKKTNTQKVVETKSKKDTQKLEIGTLSTIKKEKKNDRIQSPLYPLDPVEFDGNKLIRVPLPVYR